MFVNGRNNGCVRRELDWAKKCLKSCAVPNPAVDAELILSHVLGCRRDELFTKEHHVESGVSRRFERLVYLRGIRYPLQYITGSVDFMGLKFMVEPGVFIPRPETELLAEKCVEIVKASESENSRPKILDLCAGCGNIAVSLAKSLRAADIIASDISAEALAVANRNIRLHGCENIVLAESDLFEGISERENDMIVSNPPYVARQDLDTLMPELLYEPDSSLYGGEDGLSFYRRIFERARVFLKTGGYIAVEIGIGQAGPVRDMLESAAFCFEETLKDYNDIDRVIIARRRRG